MTISLRRLFHSLAGDDVVLPVEVACRKERLGSDYGGWTLAPQLLGPDSIVYSFGIGEDITFDLALIERRGVQVHAFDPTPRSVRWVREQRIPESSLVVHEVGLAAFDGHQRFVPPKNPSHVSYSTVRSDVPASEAVELRVQRLSTLMASLGHTHLDLLKMDVEGGEYDVIPDILGASIPIRQLLVEFHHRFRGIGRGRTRAAIEQLRAAGFLVLDVSADGQEYAFLHRSARDEAEARG